MWYTHNGERLGTYDEHNGAVWTIDVDCAYFLILSMLYVHSYHVNGVLCFVNNLSPITLCISYTALPFK